MQSKLILTLVVWLSAASSVAWCQNTATATKPPVRRVEPLTEEVFHLPVGDALQQEIDDLVTKLGSPNHGAREVSSERLVEIGLQTFGRLRRAYHDADDLEVRLRVEGIVRQAFLNHHVYDRNGFLGITMRAHVHGQRPVVARRNARGRANRGRANPQRPGYNPVEIPADESGVDVQTVVPDSGAARGGIKPDDVIVAANGKALTGQGNALLESLSFPIRSRPPGAVLTVTVYRRIDTTKREKKVLTVTLGRCPKDTAALGNVRGTSGLLREMSAEFPGWWSEHVGAVPRPSVTSDGT